MSIDRYQDIPEMETLQHWSERILATDDKLERGKLFMDWLRVAVTINQVTEVPELNALAERELHIEQDISYEQWRLFHCKMLSILDMPGVDLENLVEAA